MRGAWLACLALLAPCALVGCSSLLGISDLPGLDGGTSGPALDGNSATDTGADEREGGLTPGPGEAGLTDGSSGAADDVEAKADVGADVAEDVAATGAVDARFSDVADSSSTPPDADAAQCTPVTYPLPMPAACMGQSGGENITSPGSVWDDDPYASSDYCSALPVSGVAACEQCVETFTCTCLVPLFEGSEYTCVDGANGPYVVLQ
jgi:hypothetical protein